jgi:hypothetical protein
MVKREENVGDLAGKNDLDEILPKIEYSINGQ